jgi:hypothetical protein
VQPKPYAGKSEAEKQLSALLVRRKQVEEMLKAEQNRLRTVSRKKRWLSRLACANSLLSSTPCCATSNLSAASLPNKLAFSNLKNNNCLDKQDSCCTLG